MCLAYWEKKKKKKNPAHFTLASLLLEVSVNVNCYLIHLPPFGCSPLSQSQSGFRPNDSCHTALTKLCDNWLSVVGAVFLGLKKAFDFVNHDILLKTWSLYTWNSPSVSIFKSYLYLRTQCVYVNGEYSTEGIVRFWFPHGSILGPFLLYLYQWSRHAHHKRHSALRHVCGWHFAECISHKCSFCLEKTLQTSIYELCEWCSKNAMVRRQMLTRQTAHYTNGKQDKCSQQHNLFFTFLINFLNIINTHQNCHTYTVSNKKTPCMPTNATVHRHGELTVT